MLKFFSALLLTFSTAAKHFLIETAVRTTTPSETAATTTTTGGKIKDDLLTSKILIHLCDCQTVPWVTWGPHPTVSVTRRTWRTTGTTSMMAQITLSPPCMPARPVVRLSLSASSGPGETRDQQDPAISRPRGRISPLASETPGVMCPGPNTAPCPCLKVMGTECPAGDELLI